jgi:hypothetical protein
MKQSSQTELKDICMMLNAIKNQLCFKYGKDEIVTIETLKDIVNRIKGIVIKEQI